MGTVSGFDMKRHIDLRSDLDIDDHLNAYNGSLASANCSQPQTEPTVVSVAMSCMSALSLSSLPHELAATLGKPSKRLLDPSPAAAHFVEHGMICVTANKAASSNARASL